MDLQSEQGGLLWAAPGVASTGGANASQQCTNYHHMVLEEDVIAQHERPLHSTGLVQQQLGKL